MLCLSIQELFSVSGPEGEHLRQMDSVIREALRAEVENAHSDAATTNVDKQLIAKATVPLLLIAAAREAFRVCQSTDPTLIEHSFMRCAAEAAMWISKQPDPRLFMRGLLNNRRHERVVPSTQRSILRLPDGQDQIVKIRNISASGVGIETNWRPDLGTRIVVGSTPAVVVRHFDNGIAGEFLKFFAVEEVDEAMQL